MLQLQNPSQAAQWLRGRLSAQASLHTDSRKLHAGDAFIAWPGAATDGRQYVPQALQAGATACLVEAQGVDTFHFSDERVACYAGLKAASGPIAGLIYGEPSQHLDVLAVTGTNGKTSTSWWIAQTLNILDSQNTNNSLSKIELFRQYVCGLMGTLGIGSPGKMVLTGLTTPDPAMLQAHLHSMRKEGARACAIEASSIGIAEHRLDGARIRVAIFTNLTQDHLDYHGSMESYWLAKRELFDWRGLQAAVVNLDDPKGSELADHCLKRGLDVWTVSRMPDANANARLYTTDMVYGAAGMQFQVHEGSDTAAVHVALLGDYNVSNLLGVIAAVRALGHGLREICAAISHVTPVPGRLECVVQEGQPIVTVDYAHTPDAIEKVLNALGPVAGMRGGKLWCVFGCGGDRDASKRPLMARAAENGADAIVVTSDNPRNEAADTIIGHIMSGFNHAKSVTVRSDRAQAIELAIQQAANNDVIVIAGKGHEDYQEIAGVRTPFSDMEHVRSALQMRTTRHMAVHQESAA